MADRLQQYADWLIANQNKKGTPEFATVANSYKQLRGAVPAPAPVQTAVPQQRDGPLAYGFDRGQEIVGKGIEVAGRLIGSENVADYGTGIVEQQQKDIQAGGYQPSYPGSLRENYNKGQLLPALGEKVLENIPQMGFAIGGTAATAAAAYFGAPAWAVATGSAAVLAGSGVMGAGEAALEQEEKTGDYNAKVSAGVGALIGVLDKFGAGKVIPTDKIASMTAGEIIEELSQKGFGEAAAEITKRTMKAAGVEGSTEMAQDAAVISGAKTQGAEYTAPEIGDRAIDSFALGGVMGGGTRLGAEVVRGGAPDTPTREAAAQRLTELGETINPVMVGNDPQAAADLAKKLDGIAQANGMNLKDVAKTSTKGAREVIDKAHIQYAEDLKRLARDLRDQLGITDSDELSVVMDKVLAIAGQREARNKTKSTVGIQEMQAVERLAGNTQEGQDMLSLMRQMNELTTLHNEGYVAGLSKFTDQLSPIPSNVGYSDRSLIETPTRILGTLYGASVNPLIPAVQTAAVIGGRAVDAVTGRRSRVAKYIRDNKNNQGINAQGDFSVRENKRAEAAAIKQATEEDRQAAQEMHKDIYEQNGRFGDLSPQQILLDATGTSPQNAVSALEGLAENPTYERAARQAINSIKNGGRIPNISYVIAGLKNHLDSDQNNSTRDRQVDPAAEDRQPAAGPADVSAGYIRGIQDNRDANDALIEAVNADESITPADKATLINALADLRSNLGSNPVERAFEIASKAERNLEDATLADKYVMPYVARVMSQQPVQEDIVAEDRAAAPVNNPMRISPRRPTAKAATEDPLGEVPLQIGSDAILNSTLAPKLIPKMMNYLGVRGERQLGDTRSDEEILINHFKQNLLHLYYSVSPEYRERAKQWYVGANKLSQQAADKYGMTLAQVAGVMAALSPQKDWYMNYDLGIRTIDALGKIQPGDVFNKDMAKAYRRMIKAQKSAGGRKTHNAHLKAVNGKRFDELNDMQQAIFLRFYDETTNPEKSHRVISPEGELLDFQMTAKGEKSGTAWNGFRDIAKAISIARDGSRENIDNKLGMMHKVRSFYNNILDPMSDQGDVTVDTHAVAAAHLRPFSGEHIEVKENFKQGGAASVTGAVGSYGIYADAYRQAAAEVGILPREMQSITWEAVRGLFTPGYKGQQKNQDTIANIWKRYDAGDINIDQARQEIFDDAGRIKRAAWEGPGPSDTITQGSRSVTNPGNLSGPSLSGTGDGRGTGEQSPRPLLRPSRSVEFDADRASQILDQIDPRPPQTSLNVAEDLRNRLEAMRREDGFSNILFDKAYKTVKKAVARLDPENRATISAVAIGLDDSTRTSNEDLATLTPLITDAFRTVYGDPEGGTLGEFRATYSPFEKRLVRRQIQVTNIGEQTPDGDMTPRMFFETFLHELGHAIESQTGFRGFVEFMSKASNADPDGTTTSAQLYRKIEQISRNRRPELWVNADMKAYFLEQLTGENLTSQLKKLAHMSMQEYTANTRRIYEAELSVGKEVNEKAFFKAFKELHDELRYLYDPAELSADVIAAYLRNPKKFKAEYPDVAQAVRGVINQSKLAEYVTFHALAGMIGVGAMSQMLMAAMDDEEDRGALSPGRGVLSAA